MHCFDDEVDSSFFSLSILTHLRELKASNCRYANDVHSRADNIHSSSFLVDYRYVYLNGFISQFVASELVDYLLSLHLIRPIRNQLQVSLAARTS